MNRWMLFACVAGVCLLAAARAEACDVTAVEIAPQACAAAAVVAPAFVVSPLVAVTPSVAVAPTLFATQFVPVHVRPVAVRVRVAPRHFGPVLPRRVFF